MNEGELKKRIRGIAEVECDVCRMKFDSFEIFDNHWHEIHEPVYGVHSRKKTCVGFPEVEKVNKILDEAAKEINEQIHATELLKRPEDRFKEQSLLWLEWFKKYFGTLE
jgi:hypothetical protein